MPQPVFMPISLTIDPETQTAWLGKLVVLMGVPDGAIASTIGRCSGLHPAMTALTATCSTVAVRFNGWNLTTSPFFISSRPPLVASPWVASLLVWGGIISSGLWLGPGSIHAHLF